MTFTDIYMTAIITVIFNFDFFQMLAFHAKSHPVLQG